MDDLISRQAAIEYYKRIIDATDTDGRYNLGFVDGLEFCINHLSTMPSAQPERKKGEWIPCERQLPEFPCLVSDAQGNYVHNAIGIFKVKLATGEWIAIEQRMAEALGFEIGEPFNPEILKANRIIAWMPLPEIYKKNENDN